MKVTIRGVDIEVEQLEDGRFVKPALGQFTKSGRGCTWLDDCRVPTEDTVGYQPRGDRAGNSTAGATHGGDSGGYNFKTIDAQPASGRFPANLLVQDQALNGHSKYFDLDAWADTLPFLAVPKASKSEKNKGLEHFPDRASEVEHGNIGRAISVEKRREEQNGKNAATMKNHHPTVKPLKLMSYLITLFSREGDTVLDPFMGSGTTGVAAKNLNRNFIGIELNEEYFEIAKSRIEQSKQSNNYNPANKGEL